MQSADADFAIANVQCQYDSLSDTDEAEDPEEIPAEDIPTESEVRVRPAEDHTYDMRDEPPAFFIRQCPQSTHSMSPYLELSNKMLTISPAMPPAPANEILVGDKPQIPQADYNINKRIRRSEVVLRQAAECVSRGQTFQTVSTMFNIPISTIRFFMARKGILPRRRRGRSSNIRQCNSPEMPPFYMQHFKLPFMNKLEPDQDTTDN